MFAYRANVFQGRFGFVALFAVGRRCGSGAGCGGVRHGQRQRRRGGGERRRRRRRSGRRRVIEGWPTLGVGDVSGAPTTSRCRASPRTASADGIEARDDAVAFNRCCRAGRGRRGRHRRGRDDRDLPAHRPFRGHCGPGTAQRLDRSQDEDGKIVEWRRVATFGPGSPSRARALAVWGPTGTSAQRPAEPPRLDQASSLARNPRTRSPRRPPRSPPGRRGQGCGFRRAAASRVAS